MISNHFSLSLYGGTTLPCVLAVAGCSSQPAYPICVAYPALPSALPCPAPVQLTDQTP